MVESDIEYHDFIKQGVKENNKDIFKPINNTNMSFLIKLKAEIAKVELDLSKIPTELANAVIVANTIMQPIITQAEAALSSPTAITVEVAIPNGATYAAEAEVILATLSKSLTALTELKDAAGVQALITRAKTDIANLIAGGKYTFAELVSVWNHILGI